MTCPASCAASHIGMWPSRIVLEPRTPLPLYAIGSASLTLTWLDRFELRGIKHACAALCQAWQIASQHLHSEPALPIPATAIRPDADRAPSWPFSVWSEHILQAFPAPDCVSARPSN